MKSPHISSGLRLGILLLAAILLGGTVVFLIRHFGREVPPPLEVVVDPAPVVPELLPQDTIRPSSLDEAKEKKRLRRKRSGDSGQGSKKPSSPPYDPLKPVNR